MRPGRSTASSQSGWCRAGSRRCLPPHPQFPTTANAGRQDTARRSGRSSWRPSRRRARTRPHQQRSVHLPRTSRPGHRGGAPNAACARHWDCRWESSRRTSVRPVARRIRAAPESQGSQTARRRSQDPLDVARGPGRRYVQRGARRVAAAAHQARRTAVVAASAATRDRASPDRDSRAPRRWPRFARVVQWSTSRRVRPRRSPLRVSSSDRDRAPESMARSACE